MINDGLPLTTFNFFLSQIITLMVWQKYVSKIYQEPQTKTVLCQVVSKYHSHVKGIG